MEYAKNVEGKIYDGKKWSNIHVHLEADVSNKELLIWTFEGATISIRIEDAIDVIFQAYKRAAENEK